MPSPHRDPERLPEGRGLRAADRHGDHSSERLASASDRLRRSVGFGRFTLNDFASSFRDSLVLASSAARPPAPWASPSRRFLGRGTRRGFRIWGPLALSPQDCGSVTHPQRRPRPDPPNLRECQGTWPRGIKAAGATEAARRLGRTWGEGPGLAGEPVSPRGAGGGWQEHTRARGRPARHAALQKGQGQGRCTQASPGAGKERDRSLPQATGKGHSPANALR